MEETETVLVEKDELVRIIAGYVARTEAAGGTASEYAKAHRAAELYAATELPRYIESRSKPAEPADLNSVWWGASDAAREALNGRTGSARAGYTKE